MAKLYAELTSDKGGRVASKGGENHLDVTLKIGNNTVAYITLLPSGNIICEPFGDGDILTVIDDEIKSDKRTP